MKLALVFQDHIFENDFMLEDKKCTAELRIDNRVDYFNIVFDFIENYVFVCAFSSAPFGSASGKKKK